MISVPIPIAIPSIIITIDSCIAYEKVASAVSPSCPTK